MLRGNYPLVLFYSHETYKLIQSAILTELYVYTLKSCEGMHLYLRGTLVE